MKRALFILIIGCLVFSIRVYSQIFKFDKDKLEAVNVSFFIEGEALNRKDVIKVIKDPSVQEVDEPTFVRIKGVDFKNGTIELNVRSKILPNAPEFSRGFIGIAFRINGSNSKFECIYIRPANGRDSSQIRRNHTVQYFSFPNYKFDKLRNDAPGEYESYADIGLNEWIKLKIVVKSAQAKLFINDNKQPSLIVNDLKQGADSSGAIGLWVDVGTEGYFSDLSIHQ
ncbi:MAG: hypothetical protein HYR67_12305 [Bacteroidetes bacterium]|nr:hypothetical protein [Bacteroidota bacterium]